MKKLLMTALLLFSIPVMGLKAETKVSDITKVDGLDDNYVMGVGIVSGLAGKGDKGKAIKAAVKNMHLKLGRKGYDEKDIEARNMAIVHLTAKIPPFARKGQKVDIQVSAQSAESLEGGTLMSAFLYIAGADPTKSGKWSKPIVVAQGKVLIGNSGQVKRGNASGNTRAAQPTSGTLKSGGIIYTELPSNYIKVVKDKKGTVVAKYFSLLLDKPSFVNASSVTEQINNEFVTDNQKSRDDKPIVKHAEALSPNEIRIKIPTEYHSEVINFISRIEDISLNSIKSEAKVVVNEKTGNITTSGQIMLNACTIQYQEITFNIAADTDLDQVIQEFNDELRTRDVISILKQLHTAGHLRAKFEVED